MVTIYINFTPYFFLMVKQNGNLVHVLELYVHSHCAVMGVPFHIYSAFRIAAASLGAIDY